MEKTKVEGHINLFRDNTTNAIVNTDYTEYQKYISLRNAKMAETLKIQNLESDIQDLKFQISEIKSILMEIKNGSK